MFVSYCGYWITFPPSMQRPQQKRGQATINTFLYAFCHRNSYYFSLFLVKHNGHYIGCVWIKKAQETPGTNRIETIPIFVKRCGLLHDWCNIIMHFPHNIVIVLPLWFIRHPSTCRDNNNTKAKIAQTKTMTMTKEEFVLPPPSMHWESFHKTTKGYKLGLLSSPPQYHTISSGQ